MRIAGEAVEFRDDQRCLPHPTFGQGSCEFRAVGALATFHLDKFRDRFRTEAGEAGCDGDALSLNSEP